MWTQGLRLVDEDPDPVHLGLNQNMLVMAQKTKTDWLLKDRMKGELLKQWWNSDTLLK